MKNIIKNLFLGFVGGVTYFFIEFLYRGYSHISMAILGGLCFICIGLINEILSWKTPLWKQSLIGGAATTILEFITGCIVNIGLGWNIWDYSEMPFNILGQVTLLFSFAWCGLSIVGIILDDYLRYWFFKEDKPKYRLF